jgi:S1-C subfamily serine protease
MTGLEGSRLRKVALTGILTPALVLGAAGMAGFGVYPGHLGSPAAAASVVNSGVCTEFVDPNLASATDKSVADIAEAANPAVVTVLNLQPLSAATSGMTGMPGMPDNIPGMPGMPGSDIPGAQGPGSDQLPSDQLPGANGGQQIGDATSGDTLVPIGSGSGFIVDTAGHVITNAHVVDGAQQLKATLTDGTEVPATVVGRDDLLDVAVIKLDLPAGTQVPGIIAFGNSDSLRAGDGVVAIGNALGSFPNTVSEGIVNAVNRAFPDEGGLTTMIQHDAQIWHGNSGGPLLNLKGEVVGVNTAGIGSSPMGTDTGAADMAFAVEGNTVCNAAVELIANGQINWPYMGIQGQSSTAGQQVVDVVSDGPSAKAGLEVGDVITAFDGQKLDRQHSMLDMLFAHEPGDTVSVTVDRNGTPQTFQVTLGERPAQTD